MQQHQHDGGGGGAPQGFGGYPQTSQAVTGVAIGDEQQQKLGDLGIAEAASPISSRPPAALNFDELMRTTAETAGGSGSASGNRWPRQETMALLRIRSDMDAAFRDTTPKGPLWEQVSRKLAELGYHRNAKKCKEKFENVHKYYKRTKEGRTGRQDGKSYKFFTELEALHHTTVTAATTTSSTNPANVLPTTFNPAPAPVFLMPPPISQPQVQVPQGAPPTVPLRGNIGISFSSDSSSSSEDEDDYVEEMETETADTRQHRRKRKRDHGGGGGGIDSDQGMMEFFAGLVKQVMQKQEEMQQKFLEAIEKREQDRMIREEAWKRQDMVRLAREHELLVQERPISASRDAAIIDFLQKITGQTIQLPANTIPLNPQLPAHVSAPQPPPSVRQKQPTLQQPQSQNYQKEQQPQTQSVETSRARQSSNTSETVAPMAEQQQIVPYQDLTSGGSLEGPSSRWPKPEVIALIQIRSGMESRYQEAGPKGPLWEEISAAMQRIGYSRSAKRCKEKWENINKYFKKVKESKKKRPEDAKTCPYYHELDALYQKKVIGTTGVNVIGSGTSSSSVPVSWSTQQQQEPLQVNELADKDAGGKTDLQTSNAAAFPSYLFGEQSQSASGGAKQPEDSVRKQHQQSHGNLMNYSCNNVKDSNSDNLHDQENDDYNYEEVDENEEYDDADDDTEEDTKLDYKIQFQRQKVGSSNGGSQAPASFLAMVQ